MIIQEQPLSETQGQCSLRISDCGPTGLFKNFFFLNYDYFYSTNKKVKFYSYFEYMKIENQAINYSKCTCLIKWMRTCKNKLKHDW